MLSSIVHTFFRTVESNEEPYMMIKLRRIGRKYVDMTFVIQEGDGLVVNEIEAELNVTWRLTPLDEFLSWVQYLYYKVSPTQEPGSQGNHSNGTGSHKQNRNPSK